MTNNTTRAVDIISYRQHQETGKVNEPLDPGSVAEHLSMAGLIAPDLPEPDFDLDMAKGYTIGSPQVGVVIGPNDPAAPQLALIESSDTYGAPGVGTHIAIPIQNARELGLALLAADAAWTTTQEQS